MATNSVTTDTTNYTRIYLLVVKGGTLLTKTLFIKRANDLSPPGPPGRQQRQIVDQFLRDQTRQNAILLTRTGKNYKNKIYPQTGTTNLDYFDLYLFCFILITVCNLPQRNKDDVETLKKTRNDLSHCHAPALCETDFKSNFTQIKEVFERTLLYINDQSFTDEMNLLVNKYEQGPIAIDEIVTFYHEVDRKYSAILENQDSIIQNQENMLQNHHAMLQNDKMVLQNGNIQLDKMEAVLLRLTRMEARLPPGTTVDIPEVEVKVEEENLPRDKQEKLLDQINTDINRAILNPNDTSGVSNVETQSKSVFKKSLAIPKSVCKQLRRVSKYVFEMVRNFLSKGWDLIKAIRNCILLTFKCKSISSFVSFVRACKDGSLLNDFQGLLEAVRGCEGYADVKFVIIVTEANIYDSIYTLVKTLEDKLLREMSSPAREKQSILKGSLNFSTSPTNADLPTAPHLQLLFKQTLVQKTVVEDCNNKENIERETKQIHNEIMNEPDSAIVKLSHWLKRVFGIQQTPTKQNENEMNTANVQYKPEASMNLTMSSSSLASQKINSLDETMLQRAPSFHSMRDYETLSRAYSSSSLLKDSGSTFDPDNILLTGGYIECAKVVPVFSADEIEEGDHIVFAGAVYNRHAIVVGKMCHGETLRIVSATKTLSKADAEVGMFLGLSGKITNSDIKLDFSKQKISVVVHRRQKYSKSKVSERARRLAKGKYDKNKYNFLLNNCEHFATFCVTGEPFSIPVNNILTVLIGRGFVRIGDEQERNKKEFQNKIREQCYEMNKELSSVPETPIKAAEDVLVGDIIKYSYFNFWHEAVVLEIIETKRNFVNCQIAHNAFCGIFSYRIITEEYKIYFDGRCIKLEYGSPDYHVYDPDTVVERAKSRIGEQHFVLFSSDSSHYARWCKLKLKTQ